MLNVYDLESKYRFAIPDQAVLYKYIPENIKELSQDLKKIEEIVSQKPNSEVLNLCNSLKLKLSDSLKYLTEKLQNIPNKNYLEESDEDWVDEHMPN